jgi:uncharacterized membrane protein (UPF0127 family)
MSREGMMAAFNRTRGTCLAEHVRIASSHWSRLRGLVGTGQADFRTGQALWIVPCRGVHTLAMRFAIDVVYLNREGLVVDLRETVQPWRFTPVHLHAASVLELPSGAIGRSKTSIGDKVDIVTSQHEAAAA